MAKELMEIGGFITSGAEIVNHDNTLSGNGTANSPLGLNETVLWSGTLNKVSAYADLSAPLTAFDTVKFYCHDHNDNHSCINEFCGNDLDQLHQSLNESFVTTGGQMCYRLTRFSTNAAKTRITISNAAQYNVTGNGVIGYSQATANNADCYIFVDKIVGINRKA